MTVYTVLLSVALSATPNTWPGFLGQGGGEVDVASLPLEWSPSEDIAWTAVTPGYGQSSPVIQGDHIYVTSVDGENKQTLQVTCLSLTNGEVVWSKRATSMFPEKSSVYISRAAPTPLVDDRGVYAYFESGDILAYDHDGNPLWNRSLSKDYGNPTNEFGLSASPAQTADRLFVLVDDPKAAYLVAIDKTTGKPLWKTDRTPRTSWSSPAVVNLAGQPQIVCSSAGSVDGYDISSGEMLWTNTEVGGNTATTPIDAGRSTFLIAASPGRSGENAEKAKMSNGLMQVEKKGNQWDAKFLWTADGPTPSWASPIIHQGLAYWVNRVGAVYCLDATTGENLYTMRIPQSCWATPVAIGDRIYFFGKDGKTTVLAAGKSFEILAENDLWTEDNPPVNNTPNVDESSEERQRGNAMFSRPTVYGVAIVNGSIVLRTGSQVFCIRKTQ